MWLEHLVLFFRDQELTPPELAAVARRFGEVVHYPFLKGLDEAPEVIQVAKLEHERVDFGGLWHTDTAYLAESPMASMLIAREVPPHGGDTLFASLYAVHDALSDGMKQMLAPLRAVNSSSKAEKSRTREDRDPNEAPRVLEAEHPVVRMHPETSRKALYVNAGHTLRFVGMIEAESAPLLEYLFAHQVRPEFTCRFRWEPGSIAFWDNRCALHNPINDYHGFRRIMHRVTRPAIARDERPRCLTGRARGVTVGLDAAAHAGDVRAVRGRRYHRRDRATDSKFPHLAAQCRSG